MKSYKFGSLDGVGFSLICNVFCKMLSDEMDRVRHFKYNNYEWRIGVNVVRRINNLKVRHPLPIESGPNSILGIEAIQSYAFEPNEIRLDTKPQYYYFDTDDSFKHAITDAFVTMPRQSGRTTSLKILEETMNKINFNRLHDISIKNVIFNDPATIVFWNDGTKTVVKAENEEFDSEKGLAMAISKKVLGNKGNYYETFKKWMPEKESEQGSLSDIAERFRKFSEKVSNAKIDIEKEDNNE